MDVAMRLPDLSTNDTVVTVIRWLVEVGQPVKRGQPLVEVQTDKSLVELESVVAGTLRSIARQPGEEASTGEVIATFEAADGSSSAGAQLRAASLDLPEAPAAPASVLPPVPPPSPATTGPARTSFFAANRKARGATTAPASKSDPEVAEAAAYAPAFLLDLYEKMVTVREFEDGVKFLFLEGAMPGTIHQCQGQEATAVGVCSALRGDDFITSTFRGHGHAIAKGVSVESLLFELFGADTGCCRGKGGSMHVGDMDKGMVPGIAIVGGGVPLASGMALAYKMQGKDAVVACFFGDGAVAEGAFHEGVNLAAIWDLPAIFVCENNLYGASTHVERVMRNPRISDRAASYGFRGQTVDGNDVLAVHEATLKAAEECRRGDGPVLLELLTYRRTGHSRRDACHYQPASEREEWARRDPIDRFADALIARGVADRPSLEALRESVIARFQAAVEQAKRQPLPTPEELLTDVFA